MPERGDLAQEAPSLYDEIHSRFSRGEIMNAVQRRIWISLSAFSLLTTPAPAQHAVPMNVPVLPDTYGTIAIGDVRGLLELTGQMVGHVIPGFNEQMLRQQFGAIAGDPQLDGLPAGAGLVIVIPRSGLPFAFLEVEKKKIAAYEGLLKKRGLPAVARYEDLLLGAPNAASLDASRRFAEKVRSEILLGNGEPTVSASFKLGDLLRQYEPQAKSMLQKMDARMQQEKTTATGQLQGLKTILNLQYALGKKVDLLQISFSPSEKGLAMDLAVTPKGGIAELAGPRVPENAAGPAMLELLPATNGIRAEWTCDPEWIAGPYTNLIVDTMRESGVPAKEADEFRSWMKTSMQAITGGMAMDFGGDPANPLGGGYALSVTSEEGALQFLREMPDRTESTGMGSFYRHIGMPLTVSFKENVRRHEGAAIHQLQVKMDLRNSVPEKELMKLADTTYEVAVANKVLLYAVAPVQIESLIDAARSGKHPDSKALVSRRNLPEDGTFYADYHVAALAGFSGSGATEQQAGKMKRAAAALGDASPMQLGGFSDSDRYRMTVRVPVETLKAFTRMTEVPEVSSSDTTESTGTVASEKELQSRSKP